MSHSNVTGCPPSSSSSQERAVVLKKWHQLMVSNQEALALIMTAECGKPLAESRGEVPLSPPPRLPPRSASREGPSCVAVAVSAHAAVLLAAVPKGDVRSLVLRMVRRGGPPGVRQHRPDPCGRQAGPGCCRDLLGGGALGGCWGWCLGGRFGGWRWLGCGGLGGSLAAGGVGTPVRSEQETVWGLGS